MTDPKIEPLNPVQIESATIPTEPMLNVYANSTRQAAEQSLKSLDASINWALTLTLAELAFVVNAVIVKGAASVDERILDLVLAAIGLGGAMCFHFSIRAAKNYLNLIRFSKLEREAIRCNFKIGDYSIDHLTQAIQSYHIEWRSPLGLRVIAKKVLFEFGFVYLFTTMFLVFYYVASELPSGRIWVCALIGMFSFTLILLESYQFIRSPYIREGLQDEDAVAKA